MQLIDFDPDFYNSLPGKDMIEISEKGTYKTIFVDGEKAGIVGFIPSKILDMAFFQILIDPKFHGQGLTKEAEEMLAREYGITEMIATIKKGNIASIRAHEKAGFRYIPESELKEIREKGLLKNDEIRMNNMAPRRSMEPTRDK